MTNPDLHALERRPRVNFDSDAAGLQELTILRADHLFSVNENNNGVADGLYMQIVPTLFLNAPGIGILSEKAGTHRNKRPAEGIGIIRLVENIRLITGL